MKLLDKATKEALILLLRQEHEAYRALEAQASRARDDETGRTSSKSAYEAWLRASNVLRSMCVEAFDSAAAESTEKEPKP